MKKLLAAAALCILAVGCHRSADSSQTVGKQAHQFPASTPRKFALITNSDSVFWNGAKKAVSQFQHDTGIQVDLKICTGVADQNQILEELISQGYNGIAISPKAADDQVRQLNRAAAQANLICIDSDAPKSNRLVYLGTNNFQAGRLAGKEIVKLLPQGGQIGVFVGTFSADNARQRLLGIQEEIKGHAIDIDPKAKKEDNNDRAKPRANAEDVVNSLPEVKLLCGLWSYNGPAIAAAIGEKHKGQILAVVFDDEAPTLQAIQDGIIQATVVQRPYSFSLQALQLLKDLADKGQAAMPKQDQIDTGADVIDAGNIGQYRANLPP